QKAYRALAIKITQTRDPQNSRTIERTSCELQNFRILDFELTLPSFLRKVQRLVGCLDELLVTVAAAVGGNANACVYALFARQAYVAAKVIRNCSFEGVAVGQLAENALGNNLRAFLRCLRHEDGELVAAVAANPVAYAAAAAQQVGKHNKDRVAGVVAECVIVILEVVEVDEHERRDLPVAGFVPVGAQAFVLNNVLETAPVYES